jgi:predicted phosphodiesterase
MKILAFSDVVKWERCEDLVDKLKPDVIALAGDLTSDGFANFWLSLPESERGKEHPVKRFGVIQSHVNSFYQFLKHAGKKAKVLVIKGNHDEDIKGAYIPEKINSIHGCQEISGKTIDTKGIRFLGLGFDEAYCLRLLRAQTSTIEKFKGKIDVVVMHGENIRFVSLLKPKIIIKGGLSNGKYLVNDVPSIFTGPDGYTIIELKGKAISRILQIDLRSDQIIPKEVGLPLFKRYEWIKPYPNKSGGRRAKVGSKSLPPYHSSIAK